MQLVVFVTDDGTPDGSGPILFIQDHPTASLPQHPRELPWKYARNIASDDELLTGEGPSALDALLRDGYYLSHRLWQR